MNNIRYKDKILKNNIERCFQQSGIKNCCFLYFSSNSVLNYYIKTENKRLSDIFRIGLSAFKRLIQIAANENGNDNEQQIPVLINCNRGLVLREESSLHYKILR